MAERERIQTIPTNDIHTGKPVRGHYTIYLYKTRPEDETAGDVIEMITTGRNGLVTIRVGESCQGDCEIQDVPIEQLEEMVRIAKQKCDRL